LAIYVTCADLMVSLLPANKFNEAIKINNERLILINVFMTLNFAFKQIQLGIKAFIAKLP